MNNFKIVIWAKNLQPLEQEIYAMHNGHAFDQARGILQNKYPGAIYEACPYHLIKEIR